MYEPLELESLSEIDWGTYKSTWNDQEKNMARNINTLGKPGLMMGQPSGGSYAESIGTDTAFYVNMSDNAALSNSYSLTSAMGMK